MISLKLIHIFLGQTKPPLDKLWDSLTCSFIFNNTVLDEFSANLIHFFPETATFTYSAGKKNCNIVQTINWENISSWLIALSIWIKINNLKIQLEESKNWSRNIVRLTYIEKKTTVFSFFLKFLTQSSTYVALLNFLYVTEKSKTSELKQQIISCRNLFLTRSYDVTVYA